MKPVKLLINAFTIGFAMARRRKVTKRRKTKSQINLLGVAESVLIANVVTTGLFNTNLQQFVTGNTGTAKFGSDGSSVMSLPELLGVGKGVKFGGNYGTGRTFGTQIKANFEAHWFTMATALVLIPVGFKVAKKLTNQPRRTANKMLKMTGLGVKI